MGSSHLVAFVVTRRLLGLSCHVSCCNGGRWACLISSQFIIAMEVVGLIWFCLVDFVITRKIVGLDLLRSLLQEGLHAHLVAFVIARRSLGLCCICCRKEVVVLFVMIVKRCCHPRCLEVAIVVILLLSLPSLRFSGPSLKKTILKTLRHCKRRFV